MCRFFLKVLVISAINILTITIVFAQKKQSPDSLLNNSSDTVKTKNNRPRNAAILSAILPGAGQVYNKKYWKVPLVYAGLGAFGYFIYKNHTEYSQYRQIYRSLVDTVRGNEIESPYSSEQLKILKEGARRNRDFFVIISCAWYAANIVDALVDAYLYDFDVSDNLSLKITPFINASECRASYQSSYQTSISTGVTLKIKFK